MFELQLFVVKAEFTSKYRFWVSTISSLPYKPHYIISIHHFCWWKRPVSFGSVQANAATLAASASPSVPMAASSLSAPLSPLSPAGPGSASQMRAVQSKLEQLPGGYNPPWICLEKT